MKKTFQLILAGVFALWIPATTVHAGNSTSGGGLILKDSMNPWFLQNTTEVHYCIALDQNAFSLSKEMAHEQIEAAFKYWISEFAEPIQKYSYPDLAPPIDSFDVATQRFVYGECSRATDIIFQLGTLTKDQRSRIDDIENTIAIATRTSYDRHRLKGQGFLYFAPDIAQDPSVSLIIPANFWKNAGGRTFLHAVAHELGHVFGLPDSLLDTSLMSYNYLDAFVMAYAGDKILDDAWANEPLPPTVITRKASQRVCYQNYADAPRFRTWLKRLLGILTSADCAIFDLNGSTLRVYDARDAKRQRPVGEAELQDGAVNSHGLVTVWLPPEQTVYTFINPDHRLRKARFTAVYREDRNLTGTYKVSGSDVTIPISLHVSPAEGFPPAIASVVDGKLIDNVLSGPPNHMWYIRGISPEVSTKKK